MSCRARSPGDKKNCLETTQIQASPLCAIDLMGHRLALKGSFSAGTLVRRVPYCTPTQSEDPAPSQESHICIGINPFPHYTSQGHFGVTQCHVLNKQFQDWVGSEVL